LIVQVYDIHAEVYPNLGKMTVNNIRGQ